MARHNVKISLFTAAALIALAVSAPAQDGGLLNKLFSNSSNKSTASKYSPRSGSSSSSRSGSYRTNSGNRTTDLTNKLRKAEAEHARHVAEMKKMEAETKRLLASVRIKEEKTKKMAYEARIKEAENRKKQDLRRREQELADAALINQATGRKQTTARKPRGGGLFGSRPAPEPTPPPVIETQFVQSPPNRYLYINEREISTLNSSNARMEIDLSDQRARIYKGDVLMIETQISSGKSGFTTPTGYYSIQEKLVDKQSGRYGTWYNSAGTKLKGDDSYEPPYGATKFVGADMPYWMRITGGIGMHIGFVPDNPASHGCIRVPSNVQPLIFSKVKVGTSIQIKG